jgi:gelsolin
LQANPDEKLRANSLGEKMCTEGTVQVLDQGDGDEEDSEFWGYLGEGEIADAADDDHEAEEFAPLLFKLPVDAEPEQVGKGEKVKVGFQTSCMLAKDLLDEGDVFLLDAGWEVFLWIGKNADRSEKLGAFSKADKYCQGDLRTIDLPLAIVKSGFESNNFNSFFA